MDKLRTTAYDLVESLLIHSAYDTQMLLDCASLITSPDATHASLTRILTVFSCELADLPTDTPRPPLEWDFCTTTHALQTTADSYAHAMLLLLCHRPIISARRGILQLARMIRSPDTTPADLPNVVENLSDLHQTLQLLVPIESSPTPRTNRVESSTNLLEPIESSPTPRTNRVASSTNLLEPIESSPTP